MKGMKIVFCVYVSIGSKKRFRNVFYFSRARIGREYEARKRGVWSRRN